MNHAGHLKERLFVILNHTDMSIAPRVGAMSGYLAQPAVSGPLALLKGAAEGIGAALRGPLRDGARRALVTGLPGGGTLIEELGFSYFGPIDGHDMAQALAALRAAPPRIVAVTVALPQGTGVDIMARRCPGWVFDVGIAEQHGVTFAARMAAAGLRPFCATYSTFLQRGYDQIVHDVALQGLPVRFAIDRAGMVGADGATHAGAFGVGFLSSLPGFTVISAADEVELVHMVAIAADHDKGPIAVRYPRGDGVQLDLPARGVPLRIGQGRTFREGVDVGAPVVRRASDRIPACLRRTGPGGDRRHARRRAVRQTARPRPDRPAGLRPA